MEIKNKIKKEIEKQYKRYREGILSLEQYLNTMNSLRDLIKIENNETTLIRLENHNLIPIQQRHIRFINIDDLLTYLFNSESARSFSISKIHGKSLWIIYVETKNDFLTLCQEKFGLCGVCGGKLNKNKGIRQYNKEKNYKSNKVYCSACGRIIGNKKTMTLKDTFNQTTLHRDPKYKFTPTPIECGECNGSGKVEIYKDIYPTGEFENCPKCNGSGFFKINRDLMVL